MRNLLTSVALIAIIGTAQAESLTGEMLALNHAFRVADDEAINDYLQQALKTSPNDPALLNQAMLSAVYQQDLKNAASFLPRVRELDIENQTSDLIEIANGISTGDFATAAKFGEKFEFLDNDVMQSWALAQGGDVAAAVAHLEEATVKIPALDPIYKYETAMLLAHFSKDYEGADTILNGTKDPLYLTSQSFYAHMAIKVFNGDKDVEALIDERFHGRENWPSPLVTILDSARVGKIDPSLVFATPQSIAAEYLSFVLNQSRLAVMPYQTERMFVTLIPAIAPENDAFLTDLIAYFYQGEEYEDVIKFADRYPNNSAYSDDRDSFLFSAYMQLDQLDEARDVLKNRQGGGVETLHSIADGYRFLEEYKTALGKYEAILAMDNLPDLRHASVAYAAAICAERLDDWSKAEGYFREAIALQPDSPEMLNYLGYSLVDRNENVEEGLKFIEKAVKIDPSQAYIQDSLGWAYFHAGRYDDAVHPLELAVSQMGSDPIVNGHLGDVYWKLGRTREATYQWERALKFLGEDLPDMKRADLEDRLANGLPD